MLDSFTGAVSRLLCLGILDLLGGREVPVVRQSSIFSLLVINEDPERAVRVKNKEHVILASDVFLDQVVLALVFEDDVDFLGSWPTDVRSEHNIVRGVSMHVSLVKLAVKQLHVTTTTVNVLLVLNSELDDKRLVPEQEIQYKIRTK